MGMEFARARKHDHINILVAQGGIEIRHPAPVSILSSKVGDWLLARSHNGVKPVGCVTDRLTMPYAHHAISHHAYIHIRLLGWR
jgi:hypothetical protein